MRSSSSCEPPATWTEDIGLVATQLQSATTCHARTEWQEEAERRLLRIVRPVPTLRQDIREPKARMHHQSMDTARNADLTVLPHGGVLHEHVADRLDQDGTLAATRLFGHPNHAERDRTASRRRARNGVEHADAELDPVRVGGPLPALGQLARPTVGRSLRRDDVLTRNRVSHTAAVGGQRQRIANPTGGGLVHDRRGRDDLCSMGARDEADKPQHHRAKRSDGTSLSEHISSWRLVDMDVDVHLLSTPRENQDRKQICVFVKHIYY